MKKHYLVVAILVLCLVVPGVHTYAGRSSDPGLLTGANLNLPFARRSRVTQPFQGGHDGTDYRASNFTPIVAAKEGTVSFTSRNCPDPTPGQPNPCAGQGYGNVVYVDHSGGYQTRYAHLAWSDFNVSNGDSVVRGQQMVLSDNSGTSTGPHLHFELRSNGVPIDPDAGNTHWAGDSPFPMGYRDQDGTIHGPFRLDQAKIRDEWLSGQVARQLGSPLQDDYSSVCPIGGIDATCRYQGFERGYIYYQVPSGSAQVVYYGLSFLPNIKANENTSDWNSTIHIRNLTQYGSATVNISFLAPGGEVVASRTYNGLVGNGTWVISAADVIFDALLEDWTNPNETFEGSAIVAADQDVAVLVRTERSNSVTAFTGVSNANSGTGWGEPGSTIYAPIAIWNTWGWTTILHIQNTTPYQANFTFTYCPQVGDCEEKSTQTLAPYGKMAYEADEMGSGFFGAVKIVGTRNLAVVATQEGYIPGDGHYGTSDYNAFSQGATTVYLPSLMRKWYTWDSSFTVQNIGTSATRVEIHYYDEQGNETIRELPSLAAGKSTVVAQWGDPPENPYGVPYKNWHGTAKLISLDGQPIVAVVNQQRQQPRTHQSYSSFIAGGTVLHGPFAGNANGSQAYDSASDVMNLGPYSTSVKRYYYRRNGSLDAETGWTGIGSMRVGCFYVPTDGASDGFGGSVKITRTSYTINAVHNLARNPQTDDYGASYNMVQR